MAGLDKRVSSYAETLSGLTGGMSVLAGGFGLCGAPDNLIAEIRRLGTEGLTVVSNNCGVDGFGLGVLLEDRQIRKMVASYVGDDALFEQQLLSGDPELELNRRECALGVGVAKIAEKPAGALIIPDHAPEMTF